MYIFSGKKHFRMCAKTSLVFISALAWSVPGCVGATSDNPPLYTSCWRWTWSLFSPAATPSDDWRGRISWKIATHAAACYIQNMLWIMISRVGVGEGLGWLYSIHVSLIVKKISREDQRWIDPTNEMYVFPPCHTSPLLLYCQWSTPFLCYDEHSWYHSYAKCVLIRSWKQFPTGS